MLTVVPLCVPLFTVVLVHGWYIFRAVGWSGGRRLQFGVLGDRDAEGVGDVAESGELGAGAVRSTRTVRPPRPTTRHAHPEATARCLGRTQEAHHNTIIVSGDREAAQPASWERNRGNVIAPEPDEVR